MSTYNPTLPSTSFIGNDDFKWWLGTVKNAMTRIKLGRVKVNILGFINQERNHPTFLGQ